MTAQLEAVVGYLFDAVENDAEFITPGRVAHHLNIDPAVAGRLIQRATGVSPVRGRGYRASDIDDALLRPLVRRARPELTTGRQCAEATCSVTP